MKNSNSSITADSRHTPRTHHNPSHGASPVSTPQALLTSWIGQIDRIALADADAARALLTEVARGETVSTTPKAAQAVFNDLLAHEAYDTLVAVFNAYNALLKSHAEAEGKPFRSTLVLQLPHDWCPRAPAVLSEALGRIHAQCVQVRRPTSGHGEEGTTPTPGTTHGDKTRTRNMPVNGAFGGLATQQVDRWKKAFDVELKRHADAIAEAPQAQLDINHRKALKRTTFPHREVKDEVAADATTTTTTNTSSTAVSTPLQTPRTRTSRGDQEKPRS